jgi:hypothetical protein
LLLLCAVDSAVGWWTDWTNGQQNVATDRGSASLWPEPTKQAKQPRESTAGDEWARNAAQRKAATRCKQQQRMINDSGSHGIEKKCGCMEKHGDETNKDMRQNRNSLRNAVQFA